MQGYDKGKGAAPGFNSAWWDENRREAAAATREGFWTEDEQRAANKRLKEVVRTAKREWVDRYITTANIWEVAAWRHGCRTSHIPALVGKAGTLVYGHEEMVELLSDRFFAEERDPITTSFADDPPAREARGFPPFTKREVGARHSTLSVTAVSRAPMTKPMTADAACSV
jgi:hypothetical protein